MCGYFKKYNAKLKIESDNSVFFAVNIYDVIRKWMLFIEPEEQTYTSFILFGFTDIFFVVSYIET